MFGQLFGSAKAALPGYITELSTYSTEKNAQGVALGPLPPVGSLGASTVAPWVLAVNRQAWFSRNRAEAANQLIGELVRGIGEEGFDYADLRVPVGDRRVSEAACHHGFSLMATHLVMVWDLARSLGEVPRPTVRIEPAQPSAVAALEAVVARSLPVFSRFLVDDVLPEGSGGRLLSECTANSVRGYADVVDLAYQEERLVGYCIWRNRSEDCFGTDRVWGSLDLNGVVPEARNRHVFRALTHHGLKRLQDASVSHTQVITHVLNTGMQAACGTLGARMLAARHTTAPASSLRHLWRRGAARRACGAGHPTRLFRG